VVTAAPAAGFELRLAGREPVDLVCRLAGLDSTSVVTEHAESDARGNARLRKVPGPTAWGDIVIARPVDASRELWTWREAVLRSGADRARVDGTVALLDAEGSEVALFAFTQGWPARYRIVGFDDPAGAVLEEVVICHEGLTRVP
jgi:phage tail-like protein